LGIGKNQEGDTMNLHHLFYFKTTAELEHFTKASEKLNVTQPNLSHAIRDLEDELGVHLFERQGRSVKLTRYGELYLEYVNRALRALNEGKEKLDEYVHPDRGTVHLSYLSSLNQYVPWLNMKFYGSTERIATRFEASQSPTTLIEEGILNGTFDLGISSIIDRADIESYYLGNHKTVLVVSDKHPWAGRGEVDFEELESQPFVTYTMQCGIRHYIDGMFRERGIAPQIVSEVLYDNLILGIVASNFGVSLIPEPLGYRFPKVKVLQIAGGLPGRNIYLVWSKRRYMSPATEVFRDFIIQSDLSLERYLQEEIM